MKEIIKTHFTELLIIFFTILTGATLINQNFKISIFSLIAITTLDIIGTKDKTENKHPLILKYNKPFIFTILSFSIIILFITSYNNILLSGFFIFIILINHTLSIIIPNRHYTKFNISIFNLKLSTLAIILTLSFLLLENNILIFYILIDLFTNIFIITNNNSEVKSES